MGKEAAAGAASSEAGKGAEGTGAAGAAGAEGKGAAGAAAGSEGKGAGDGKAGATGSGTSGDGGDGKAVVKNAPEKYALKLAEGSRLTADDVKQLETDARAADWTNDQAAAVLAEYENRAQGQATKFLETSKADKTYGGDNFQETERLAKLGIAKFRPEGHAQRAALMDVLNRTGYGNHIAVLSFFADLGKLFAEDSPAGGNTGGSGGKGERTAASVLYGGGKK